MTVVDRTCRDLEPSAVLPANMVEGNLARNELRTPDLAKVVNHVLVVDGPSSHDENRFSRRKDDVALQ